jgi:PAS domain S-box-containing protein
MARSTESAWFDSRSSDSVRDFFALCELADLAPGARDRLRRARDGDWQPLEHHLRTQGALYAREGVPFSAWSAIADNLYNALIGHAVAAHGADPARLASVLHVLGDYMKDSLSIVATAYFAIKQHLERDAEVRHTQVLDAAHDPVIEIDDRGVITEFNRAAEQAFGHRKAEAIGQALVTLIIPERFREAHRAAVARYLATGEARVLGRRVELSALRRDGSEFSVELALVVTTGLDGRPRFTGFLRDLSEQQRVAESLALRAHALEQATFGIVISDPDTGVITSVNPAYARMTGYAPRDLVGSSGYRLVASTTPTALSEIRRTLVERGHHTYAMHLLRKDGEVLPVLASSSTVETRGARMRISSVIDISERDRLERERARAATALARSAARLEILANAAHDFATCAGDVRALLDLVAHRLGEAIGDGCVVRLLSDDGQWIEPSGYIYHRDPGRVAILRQVVGSERQRVGEGMSGRVAATGNAVLLAELSADEILAMTPRAFRDLVAQLGVASSITMPLRSRGRTIGVISLMRNQPGDPYTIDDQRFAQDLADRAGLAIDNAMLVATLEQRVADRTATLETVNRELEAFSYSVSHDLRTPLRAIDGFGEILVSEYDAALGEAGRQHLTRIREATRRMARLIDDLLDLARISREPLRAADVDLSAIAREVIAELRRGDPDRVVDVDIAPGIAARADARLVAILFENLLGNAWKFTAKHPGARIWFGATAGAFYVRDTGAGFDMAYAGKLFLPFQRLHGLHEFDGTGVGLATVHRIIARHGGKIWAEAEVDRGATFYFTLGPTG